MSKITQIFIDVLLSSTESKHSVIDIDIEIQNILFSDIKHSLIVVNAKKSFYTKKNIMTKKVIVHTRA